MANFVRWYPVGELADMRGPMDRFFQRGFARPWRLATRENGTGFFAVDLYETDEDVVIKASLPGVKPEQIQVSVTGDTLTLKGETAEEHETREQSYYRKERRSGAFQRTLLLPVEVDADNADATFENGLLSLRLPKAQAVRSKTIEVKATAAAEGAAS